MNMKTWKALLLAFLVLLVAGAVVVALLIHRGFRATTEPSRFETAIARTVRDFAIPSKERTRQNPLEATSQNLNDGRENFLARCANCHGRDGSGTTAAGQSLYPRVPDLRATKSQDLTDGELHYIIENGVALTGMPA
jgi:cytochrome c553